MASKFYLIKIGNVVRPSTRPADNPLSACIDTFAEAGVGVEFDHLAFSDKRDLSLALKAWNNNTLSVKWSHYTPSSKPISGKTRSDESFIDKALSSYNDPSGTVLLPIFFTGRLQRMPDGTIRIKLRPGGKVDLLKLAKGSYYKKGDLEILTLDLALISGVDIIQRDVPSFDEEGPTGTPNDKTAWHTTR